MGRTFQHSSLFDGMTARENVAVAAQRKSDTRAISSCRPPASPTSRPAPTSCSRSSASPTLRRRKAGSLSYGHRRQLEVALALATEPRLLLLDEPTAGMSRDEAQRFMTVIGGLPRS